MKRKGAAKKERTRRVSRSLSLALSREHLYVYDLAARGIERRRRKERRAEGKDNALRESKTVAVYGTDFITA